MYLRTVTGALLPRDNETFIVTTIPLFTKFSLPFPPYPSFTLLTVGLLIQWDIKYFAFITFLVDLETFS